MGQSKRSRLNKIQKQRYWDGSVQGEGKPRKLVNKKMHCHKYVTSEGRGRGTVIVEIKDSKCSIANRCYAMCKFR
jgi:hypothetical protein